MMIFDYGQTLLSEQEWDDRRGYAALLRCATKNPRNIAPEALAAFAVKCFRDVGAPLRDREIHQWQVDRLIFDLLGLEFSLTPEEQERVFHEACIRFSPMPHAEELLERLRGLGIRTGVMSNIRQSRAELERRFEKYFPSHKFEFVIASSEYGVRKPDPLIFQLALAKANLPPEDIWFCGDHGKNDVDASCAMGMRPVWYTDETTPPLYEVTPMEPVCPHLRIYDWRELISYLKECT